MEPDALGAPGVRALARATSAAAGERSVASTMASGPLGGERDRDAAAAGAHVRRCAAVTASRPPPPGARSRAGGSSTSGVDRERVRLELRECR